MKLTWLDSPLGRLLAGAVDDGVCLLAFDGDDAIQSRRAAEKAFGRKAAEGDSRHFPRLRRELEGYFAGRRMAFTVPLALSGTPFQRAAWEALEKIPYGATRSYAQQAAALGRPTAVRAVAGANHANRVSILLPCHRIIGADGRLVGYAGGLERKRWLLDHERRVLGGEA